MDDGEINRAMLRRILCVEYETIEAENGAKALRILENNPEISAVVLDLLMPVMDGFALLVAARSNPQLAAMPMLVTTQANDPESELRALECGATDFVGKPYKPAVVKQRLANLLLLSEAAALHNTIERDELTGLYNKKTFFAKAQEWLDLYADGQNQLICFDVERFKIINDLYGNDTGDNLLRFVAKKTREATGRTGICGRLDSDSFAICLPVVRDNAQRIMTRLNKAVGEYPLQMDILLAFGIYHVESAETPVQQMYDRAKTAAGSIKGSYTTHWALYDDAMRSRRLREQTILNDTQKALDDEQFEVWLQPKYNMDTGCMIGAEALARWRHPENGLLMPNDFIPVLEHNGCIIELDQYVWDRTCRMLRSWLDAGFTPVPVSVNLSRMNFYRSTLCDTLKGLVKKYQLPQGLLELEITESAYAENARELIEVTRQLQKNGFRVLMDNFGSGYSSLDLLKDIPVDELKIDLGLLRDGALGRGGVILSSVVRMAAWLQIPVTAEGVETAHQVNFLRSIGCVRGQGYYYAKPLALPEFEQLLDAQQRHDVGNIPQYCGKSLTGLMDIESSYNTIFNSIDEQIGMFEMTGTRMQALRLNDAYYRIAKVSRTEVQMGVSNVFDLLRPYDSRWLLDELPKMEQGQVLEGTVYQNLPDGHSLGLTVRIRLLADDGVASRLFLMTAWEGEGSMGADLQRLLDHIPAGLGVYDVSEDQIRIRYLSRGMAKLNELPQETYYWQYGSDLAAILGKEKAEQLRRACLEAFQKNELLDMRYPFQTHAKNERWAWMCGRMVKGKDGALTCYALVSDVTEAENIEKELKRAYRESRISQERYATALLLSGSDLWEYEFATETAYMKTNLMKRYGIDEMIIEDFKNRVERMDIIDPEFIKDHRQMYKELESGAENAGWIGCTQLLSGEKRWVQVRMHNIFDEDGHPERAIGVLEDVTDQINTQQKYALAEQQRMSLTVDVLASVVLDVDEKRVIRIESYSDELSFLQNLQTPDDMMQMILADVEDKAQQIRVLNFIDFATLRQRWEAGNRSGEIEYQQKMQGEKHWVRMSFRMEQNEMTGHLIAFGLLRDIDDSKTQQLRLQMQAQNDSLTGVLNRGALTNQINDLLITSGSSGAFVILDLDNFKAENDSRGHQYGDALLSGVALAMRQTFRKGDVVGRLGGDEFVAFLTEINTPEGAHKKMELLYSKLWLDMEPEHRKIMLSAGISLAPKDGADFDTLYAKADAALYEAKHRGKNSWCLYQESFR